MDVDMEAPQQNSQLGDNAPDAGCKGVPLNLSDAFCTHSHENKCPTTQFTQLILSSFAEAKMRGRNIQKRFDRLQSIHSSMLVSRHSLEAVSALSSALQKEYGPTAGLTFEDHLAHQVMYNVEEERNKELKPGEFVKCLHVDLDWELADPPADGETYTEDEYKTMFTVKNAVQNPPWTWMESGMVLKEGLAAKIDQNTKLMEIPDGNIFVYILFPRYQNCFQFVRVLKRNALICSVEHPRKQQGIVVQDSNHGCQPAIFLDMALKPDGTPYMDTYGQMYKVTLGVLDQKTGQWGDSGPVAVSSGNWLPVKRGQNFPNGVVPYNRYNPDMSTKDHPIDLQRYPWVTGCKPKTVQVAEVPFQSESIPSPTPPTTEQSNFSPTIDSYIQEGLKAVYVILSAHPEFSGDFDGITLQKREKGEISPPLKPDEQLNLEFQRFLDAGLKGKAKEFTHEKAQKLKQVAGTPDEQILTVYTYQKELGDYAHQMKNFYDLKVQAEKKIAEAKTVEEKAKAEKEELEKIKAQIMETKNTQTAQYADMQEFVQTFNTQMKGVQNTVLLTIEEGLKENKEKNANTHIKLKEEEKKEQSKTEQVISALGRNEVTPHGGPFGKDDCDERNQDACKLTSVNAWLKYMQKIKCPKNLDAFDDPQQFPDHAASWGLRTVDKIICYFKIKIRDGDITKFVQENPMHSLVYSLILFGSAHTLNKRYKHLFSGRDRDYRDYRDDYRPSPADLRRREYSRDRGYGYGGRGGRYRRNTTKPRRRRSSTRRT